MPRATAYQLSVKKLHDEFGIAYGTCQKIYKAVFSLITEETMKHGECQVIGFGKFYLRGHKGHSNYVHPKTKLKMVVKPYTQFKFSPCKKVSYDAWGVKLEQGTSIVIPPETVENDPNS